MGVAVAIVPCLLMAVLPARWYEAIQQLRQIVLESWLKFDRSNRGRASDIEHLGDASANSAFGDNARHLLRDILHVPVARGIDLELLLADHEGANGWVAVSSYAW
jgi:hypothetical protein